MAGWFGGFLQSGKCGIGFEIRGLACVQRDRRCTDESSRGDSTLLQLCRLCGHQLSDECRGPWICFWQYSANRWEHPQRKLLQRGLFGDQEHVHYRKPVHPIPSGLPERLQPAHFAVPDTNYTRKHLRHSRPEAAQAWLSTHQKRCSSRCGTSSDIERQAGRLLILPGRPLAEKNKKHPLATLTCGTGIFLMGFGSLEFIAGYKIEKVNSL